MDPLPQKPVGVVVTRQKVGEDCRNHHGKMRDGHWGGGDPRIQTNQLCRYPHHNAIEPVCVLTLLRFDMSCTTGIQQHLVLVAAELMKSLMG